MEQPDKKQPDQLRIHNKISNNFHELHVDGAFGGITPRGLLNINFYAERLPIPKATDFKVTNNKLENIGDSADSKKGIIREFEVGIYMTIDAAKQLHKWLEDNIDKFNKLKGENNDSSL